MTMRFGRWLDDPQPILRLELTRILAPLAILGFLSSRLTHVGEWVGDSGFRLPEFHDTARHPIEVPPLSGGSATVFAVIVIATALAVSMGFHPRKAALVLGLSVAYAALGDRLSTFTVTKITPAIAFALAASPCGSAYSVHSWLRRRAAPAYRAPARVAGGSVRFFQLFLCTIYGGSGIAKAQGDWLNNPLVLWTHLHDSQQTRFSLLMANAVPAAGWTVAQAAVLVFEALAPLWFALPRTRTTALVFAVTMHAFIGACFWPVRWFALLMISLLLGAFLPERVLEPNS
ncbi:MAG TPA: HTTM domain-containing protein [Polyangiaceae bacterium]